MLEKSGGQNRIAEYGRSLGQDVDAEAIHRSKSELFQRSLAGSELPARSGVVDTVRAAKEQGFKVALVTTTSPENVRSLIASLRPAVRLEDFDLTVDASSVDQPKPDRAAYSLALEQLGEDAGDCVAIEDNLGGVEAARAAGLTCIAFPNENTVKHDFGGAQQVDRLDFRELHELIATK